MSETDHTLIRDTLAHQMQWRYATKLFDASRSIPNADWDMLLESLRLAPSSYGLQPWRFVVAQSSDMRQKLAAAAPLNKAKIETASHVVVLAQRTSMSADYIDAYVQHISDTRGVPVSALQDYRNIMVKQTGAMSPEVQAIWNSRQTYIALGSLLTTAALLGVDTCAMEGIDTKQFDAILGLANSDYASVVCVALGYRSAEDQLQFAKKVRFARQDVVTIL